MTANDFTGGTNLRYKDPTNNFIQYGNVSLFYVGDGFFTVILIYPYDDLLARLTNDITVVTLHKVKFNRHIMLENSKDKVSSGLLKVIDTDFSGGVTVNLEGLYPEDIESEYSK